MSLAFIIVGCAAVLLVIAVAHPVGRSSATAARLRWLALLLTVGLAFAVFPTALADSGGFAFALIGFPLVAATLPLLAQSAGRWIAAVSTLGAIVMLGWGVLLGLGVGGYFILVAPVLGLAAAMSAGPRHAASTLR